MKAGFFPMLAVSGMRKNRQLYTPYLLACAGIVCVSYIVAFLGVSPVIRAMRGGTSTTMILQLGKGVMAVFSAIFLFYSHSFLIRRRKREFGLYNMLGMGKRSIGRILLWEALMSAALSLLGGLALGVLLSKLCELLLVNLLRGSVTFTFTISVSAIRDTALLFAAIFALMALFDQGQVRLSSPAELMRSESAGEKPPRANYALGVLGAALLAAAYYLAVSIQQPLEALTWFFVAVIMVIIATYLLFIAGSVVLCRLLQKNKRFYYQARHFVSVASMTYRMKRNGAGLASICILATMVLVMLSSSACLYFGAEDSLNATYPNEFELTVWVDDSAELPALEAALNRAGAPYGVNIWEKGTVTQDGEIIWSAAFDTGLSREQQLALGHAVGDALSSTGATWGYSYTFRAEAADDFYGTYGSLFFIGIVLSIMFICAAVLIIYYKQLCEGYEDQPRFAIMQKVGMTAADIRRSVNSQLLTVFFLPLAGAALHMAFAFPMIRRMLLLFELHNTGLFVATVLISFAVLAAVYTLVYKATSNAYYRIVKNSV